MFVQSCSYNYILRASKVRRLNTEDWATSANLSTRNSDQAKNPRTKLETRTTTLIHKKQPFTYQFYNGETLTIPLKKHQDIYISINDAKERMYTDQTGAFPVTTKKGNKYIMIICEIDNNVIISEAMFNRIQASHKSK